MIVGTRPRFRQILAEVWKPLAVLFAWDVMVTAFHFYTPFSEPPLPTTLFGTALALFLGFRTNAAYARWWEARSLWGALINASRSLARASKSFMAPDRRANVAVDDIVLRQIAIAHALRCQLRGQDPMPEIDRLIGTEAAATIASKANRANGLAEEISALVADAHLSGRIDTIQQATLERLLIDISNAQGGMERIKNTPLPNGFRFFPNLFTRIFCVLVPIALVETLGIYTPLGSTLIGLIFLAALSIGEDLMDPFANSVHDVPLSAMCRTIEIDLLQSLNREAPPKLDQVHGILW